MVECGVIVSCGIMCGFSTLGLISLKAALAYSGYVCKDLTYSVGMLLFRAALPQVGKWGLVLVGVLS